MKHAWIIVSVLMVIALTGTGCDSQQSPVEGAKDALDLREHEKLKDAGEDAADALENVVEAAKEEIKAD